MNADLQPDWTDANQRLLTAEFARIKTWLERSDPGDVASELEAARKLLPEPAAIDTLVHKFGLSEFERDVLLLVAGVEMDAKLAALCGETLGQPNCPWATFGLALAALPSPHWSALAPVRPLRRWRIIEVDESAGLASVRLRIDERILHYLAGLNYAEPRLEPLLRRPPAVSILADSHAAVCDAIVSRLDTLAPPLPLVQLHGDDLDGQEDVATRAAERLGRKLAILDARDVPEGAQEATTLATLWEREAALQEAALLVQCNGDQPSAAVVRFVERVGGPLLIALDRPVNVRRATERHLVRRPDRQGQRRLWTMALGREADKHGAELDRLAGQFRFSGRTISRTAAQVNGTSLWQLCRSIAPTRLHALAQRIEPRAGWDDLVLPDAQKQTLGQITTHVKNRLKVYEEWGFAGQGSRGLGISALFTGESGTGKTLAAEVLARELELDLFRIDLSAVVSKYIGETEKNLRGVFDAAEESGAILLFDEADALFGKRSEVKDSHDRYANIEVSYLLQRMETYRGLAILTTNLKASLDTAFQRRLRFVVPFPFPDIKQREEIWRGVFPADTPLEGIDYARLARLDVAGGNIRSIALNAAFLAAEAGGSVDMAHLLRAAHYEAAKRERPPASAEIKGWV